MSLSSFTLTKPPPPTFLLHRQTHIIGHRFLLAGHKRTFCSSQHSCLHLPSLSPTNSGPSQSPPPPPPQWAPSVRQTRGLLLWPGPSLSEWDLPVSYLGWLDASDWEVTPDVCCLCSNNWLYMKIYIYWKLSNFSAQLYAWDSCIWGGGMVPAGPQHGGLCPCSVWVTEGLLWIIPQFHSRCGQFGIIWIKITELNWKLLEFSHSRDMP